MAVLALGLLAVPAGADDEDHEDAGHEAIRGAVERGEARPLAEILALVRSSVGGEIVGVELEHKAGRWLYELRVVESGGRVLEVYVDAATARVVRTEVK